MSQPLVDIIIPSYNCAQFVGEAINSALTQDYRNLRVTVIDDASTDNTSLVLCKFRDRIRVIRHEGNRGEQVAVNDGLLIVTGDYFIILNADDLLLPGAVSKLVDFMESHPDILCGYPDWQSIDEAGNVRRQVTVKEYDFKFLISHSNWQMSVGSVFRSEVIRRIGYRDESFRWLGDADYWVRVALVGEMARIPHTLACWRNRNGQASGQKSDARAKEFLRVMEKLFPDSEGDWIEDYCAPENQRDFDPMAGHAPHYLFRDEKREIARSCRAEAMCWANLVAASVTDSGQLGYIWQAVKAYPQIMLSLEFWDSLRARAIHILRR